MRKRLWLAVIVSIVIASGIFTVNYRDEFDYNRAQKMFKTGGDEKAFTLAQKIYKNDITNKKYRKFYLETIKRLELNYPAQEALLSYINDGIFDYNQSEAESYLTDLKKIITEKYSPNYIEQVPYNNKIIRWAKFPIKVKIEKPEDLDIYFTNEVQQAFLEWQRVSEGKISFDFTTSEPDILIKYEDIPKEIKENKDRLYVVANTEPEFDENKLKKMTVTFYIKNNNNEYFSKEEIYNTALHEIAHTLGVCGHSKYQDDVLYFSSTYNADKEYYQLSESDINTMKLLYDIKPDITNGNAEFSIHPTLVFGNKEDISSAKLLEAERYIKQAPKLPNGYIDLAQNSIFAKDYETAKNALKQAIKYAKDDNTKFIIYYNFAVIHYEMNDLNKALFYAEKAQEFRDKNSVVALLANIHYKKHDYKKATESYELLAKNYPTSVMYNVNLVKLYINQWQFRKAAKTLHKLVENNPDAIQDKRVKNFQLLMLILK